MLPPRCPNNIKYLGSTAHPILLINRVGFMYNEKKPVRDYIQNLTLMNIAMGEMIHQLENIVLEDEKNEEN